MEPKVFDSYEEMWNIGIEFNHILPIIKDFKIIGYKIWNISDIEEEYRWLCKEFFDKGIVTEKQIMDKYNYPYWVASEIVMKQIEIGEKNLMSNCFYI